MKKIKEIFNFYVSWTPYKSLRIFLLIFPFVLFWLIKFQLNNDFWFLINTGKEILKNGFINIEPFTIHSGLFFIPQQWLTDIIFYLIYNEFDVYGMFVLLNIVNGIIIFLMYKLFLLISNNKYKLSIFAVVIIDSVIIKTFLNTRPQIFDIIFILLEIYLLELYIRKDNKKYLAVLPIISVLMINLHASIWPMLFVILVPYYLGRINLKRTTVEKYKIKPLIIATVLMLICGFINPYGINMMLYLFRSFGLKEINGLVMEMKPTTINNGFIAYILICIVLLSYYLVKKKDKKITIRYFLLFLGTSYLCLSHVRGLLFLLIVCMLPVMDNFKDSFKLKNDFSIPKKYIDILAIVLILMLGCFCAFNVKFESEKENFLYGFADYLNNHADKDIKLYTNYDTGSYMEYMGYKCYIDPRAELFYKSNNKKEDIMIEYTGLFYNVNPKDFLNKYKFDYLLVSKGEQLYYYLENLDYSVVYETSYFGEKLSGYRLYRNNEVFNEKNS